MATKKQKRQAALAKHEEMMAELERTGLEAQRQDRERREAMAARAKADARRENKRLQSILDKKIGRVDKKLVPSDS